MSQVVDLEQSLKYLREIRRGFNLTLRQEARKISKSFIAFLPLICNHRKEMHWVYHHVSFAYTRLPSDPSYSYQFVENAIEEIFKQIREQKVSNKSLLKEAKTFSYAYNYLIISTYFEKL